MEILEIVLYGSVRMTVFLIQLLGHLVTENWDIIADAFRTRDRTTNAEMHHDDGSLNA